MSPRIKKISQRNSYETYCGNSFKNIYDEINNQRKSDDIIQDLVMCERIGKSNAYKYYINKSSEFYKKYLDDDTEPPVIKPIGSGIANIVDVRSCIGFKNQEAISKKYGCSSESESRSESESKSEPESELELESELEVGNALIHYLAISNPAETQEHIYIFFENLIKYTKLRIEDLEEMLNGAYVSINKDGGLFYDIIINEFPSSAYTTCEFMDGSSHKSDCTQLRVGRGAINCVSSEDKSYNFDLLIGKKDGNTWFQFEQERGTIRKDGTVNMKNWAHTKTTVDYGSRKLRNILVSKIPSLFKRGIRKLTNLPDVIATNVGPCGHSTYNDNNPLFIQLKYKIKKGTGNRRKRAQQIFTRKPPKNIRIPRHPMEGNPRKSPSRSPGRGSGRSQGRGSGRSPRRS